MKTNYATKITLPLIFVITFSLFLIFCWTNLLFGFGWLWNDVQTHPFVNIMVGLNLMSFNPNIGGHQAHLHGSVWISGIVLPLIYAISVGFFLKNNSIVKFTVTRLGIIAVSLLLFVVVVWTTISFLTALERFAYVFFVPQV